MYKIIYGKKYLQYNFGPEHPFWAGRGAAFLDELKVPAKRAGRRRSKFKIEIVEPPKASDEEVLLVHTRDYLNRVKRLAREHGYLSIDTPLNPSILEAAYYSVGGTILACNLALEGQRAINTLGGLHHAGPSSGSGFCVFNDHGVAIRKLQKEGKIKRVMIFDLDVHAGNGTQEIFYSDPTVFNISIHQDPTTLYPGTGFADEVGEGEGKGFNLNVPLPPGTGESKYLAALDSALPLKDQYKPDLTILILGVDTYRGDPLANFNLEIESYRKIGQRFAKMENLAVLFAGGYSKDTPKLWFSFLEGLKSPRTNVRGPLGLPAG